MRRAGPACRQAEYARNSFVAGTKKLPYNGRETRVWGMIRQQLSQSEYQALVEQAPMMIWRSNAAAECDYFNEVWLQFRGRTMEQECHSGWTEGIHPDDFERCVKAYLDAFQKREPFEMEFRLRRHDGAYRWIFDRGVPFFSENERFQGYVGSCIDVTARVEAERALEEARQRELATCRELQQREAKIQRLVDANIVGVLMSNVEGQIVEANDAFLNMVGYSREDLTSGRLRWTQLTPPEWRACTDRAVAHLRETGRCEVYEKEYFRQDGTRVPVLLAAAAVEDTRGEYVAFVLDLTERKRAEQAREEIEERWKAAFESNPTMYFIVDAAGTIVSVNAFGAEQLGYGVGELLGRSVLDVFYEPDRDPVQKHAQECFKQPGRTLRWEARKIRKNGTMLWVRETANAVFLKKRPVLLVVCEDITEQKRAEALLSGEKRILEMVAKANPLPEILDGLCRLVEEQASGVLASILLVESGELRHGGAPSLPKAYTEAIDGVRIGPCVGSCGTAAYRSQQVIVEDIATDPLWADYREAALPHSLRACWSTPIFSSEHKVIGTFAMYYREPRRPSHSDQELIEQITYLAGVAIERELTYEQLQRSEAYLAEAQKLAHTGSWAFRVGSKTAAYWSEENFRIWAFDPEQGPPDRDTVVERVHRDDRDRVIEAVQSAISAGKDYAVEFKIVLPDGTNRYIHGLGHPVFSASGEPVELVGTDVDVTERKHAEQERERLRQLEADLAHMNRVSMMGELAASLSHELKQPITAAITNANTCLRWLARDQPDVEEVRKAAKRIVADGTRAADIIDRLRSLYKKGAPPERELVDVNELLREMLALLRGEAVRYSVSMRTDLAAGLPKVRADRVQLQQVLLNLMLNAIEAMKDSAGVLTTRSQLGQDGQLLISVSDTGVGLPVENTDQIFDAFFTTKPQGSGMGLAISRSIVKSHGGRLWATANSGRGATFHFTLPAVAEAMKVAASSM